jgi:hypothetical protein
VSGNDPLGRRALFAPPTPGTVPAPRVDGKESLYSAAARTGASHRAPQWATVVLDCSSCGQHSRVTWAEFAWRHLPFWLWVPWLRYSQLMSCPACQRRTWLRVSFFS